MERVVVSDPDGELLGTQYVLASDYDALRREVEWLGGLDGLLKASDYELHRRVFQLQEQQLADNRSRIAEQTSHAKVRREQDDKLAQAEAKLNDPIYQECCALREKAEALC